MNFRTVSDLFATVRANAHKLPRNVGIVVGVPRSGILAATAISLALHKPFIDLDSFLAGHAGSNLSTRLGSEQRPIKSALVVDDTILWGNSMRKARDLVAASGVCETVHYAAVYGAKDEHPEADTVLDICPSPRAFEWNIMNHWALGCACVDMDGVLCPDPTEWENDDGPQYEEFLRHAPVLNAPKHPIKAIVTCRLEKHRKLTEGWLSRAGIKYEALHMLDMASAEERRARRIHGRFKADIYARQRDAMLFIESDLCQAKEIRALTGKSVLAYTDMLFLPESAVTTAKKAIRQGVRGMLPSQVKSAVRSLARIN